MKKDNISVTGTKKENNFNLTLSLPQSKDRVFVMSVIKLISHNFTSQNCCLPFHYHKWLTYNFSQLQPYIIQQTSSGYIQSCQVEVDFFHKHHILFTNLQENV